MNLHDAPLGLAFEGDYRESYGERAVALRAVVARQVGRLGGATAEQEALLLGVLIGRRSGDVARAQLDTAGRAGAPVGFLARGELLMGADAGERSGVDDVLAGWEPMKSPAALRLRRLSAGRADVEQAIGRLGEMQVEAWPNYLTTMAAVGKGVGGPENAPPLGPAAEHRPPGSPAEPVRQVTVAVVDTGIQAAARGDGWLADVPRRPDRGNVDELDLLPSGPDAFLDYQAGHGTFVAGVVQRVAPTARVRVYRAADSDGFATDADIAEAVREAVADGADVLNLSLGSRTPDDRPPRLMQRAVEQALDGRGREHLVIVAAAGNLGTYDRVWPAALPGVEAVAGLTPYLTPARWSSYGDVRFSTVAEGIRSVFPQGQESPLFDPEPDYYPADAWALWSGTSFAAPQIAGAVARIVAEGAAPTVRAAVDLLDERGRLVPGYGKAMRILEGVG